MWGVRWVFGLVLAMETVGTALADGPAPPPVSVVFALQRLSARFADDGASGAPAAVKAVEPDAEEQRDPALSEMLFAPTDSGGSHSLALGDLEQIALENNPTLIQARMAVRAAEGRCLQAGLWPNPTLGYAGADLGIEGTAGQHGAVLGQEFVTAGKLRLGRAAASHEVQQARHVWQAQVWRVLNDVRGGYYDVLLWQKMVEVNRQLVRIGQEGVEVTEKLRAAMEVGEADVLQARIEAETAGLGLSQAEIRHRVVWRQLAAVLGLPEMEPSPLAGDVEAEWPQLESEECLHRLLAGSPELAEARAGVERARCELAYQWAQRRPNFEIGLGAKYDDSTFNGLADVELSVPLPIFDWNQGNIAAAKAELITAEREVRRVELSLYDRHAAAFAEYDDANIQVKTYKDAILPSAKRSLELTQTGYREGEFDYLALLTAQRTFFNVSLEYLANLRELWNQSVNLEGMLLRGGLEQGQ